MDDKTRRGFLKFATYSAGAAVGIQAPLLALLSSYRAMKARDASNAASAAPATSQAPIPDPYAGVHFDHDIHGVHVHLHGVMHNRDFALAHYDELEKRIDAADLVVSEGAPNIAKLTDANADGKAYFSTVGRIAHAAHKPVLYMDPITSTAFGLEDAMGLVGVAVTTLAGINLARSTSRRNAIRAVATALSGTYLTAGSFTAGQHLLPREIEAATHFESALLNHTIDQRNVQYLDRLLKVCSQGMPESLAGKNVLVEFGAMHAIGVNFYLQHPNVFAAKKAIYSATFDLVDNNCAQLFIPQERGWRIQEFSI